NKGNTVLELQQRSIEFSSIIQRHQSMKSSLLERMHVLDEANYLVKRAASIQAAVPSVNSAPAVTSGGPFKLPNGVGKPAAPLADLLDLSGAPSISTDILMDLLSIGSSSVQNGPPTSNFSLPSIETKSVAVTPQVVDLLDGLSSGTSLSVHPVRLDPASNSTLPASGNGSVTQSLSVTNNQHGQVVLDKFSGRSRGLGFVNFNEKQAMEDAIEATNGLGRGDKYGSRDDISMCHEGMKNFLMHVIRDWMASYKGKICLAFFLPIEFLFLFFGFKHALKFNIENPIYVIVLSQICVLLNVVSLSFKQFLNVMMQMELYKKDKNHAQNKNILGLIVASFDN
ncbi:hypothetical protein ACJX0J_040757, partial [Zea mays]